MADLLFDTTQNTPHLTLVSQAIVELLEPLRYDRGDAETGRGPYLKTVGRAPCSAEEILREGLPLQEIVKNLPAAVLVMGRSENTLIAPHILHWRHHFMVECFSAHPGQWIEGRLDPKQRGDARRDPGIFAILQHVQEQLHYRTLDTLTPASGSIMVQGQEHILSESNWTAWRVLATVTTQQSINLPDERDAAPVEQITVSHDVNNGGTITRQRRVLS